MKPVLIFFVLMASVYAVSVQGTFDFTMDLRVSGGSGTLTVVEIPGDYPGQESECTQTEFTFPPYEHSFSCRVNTHQDYDTGYEVYDTSGLTEFTPEMQALASYAVLGKESDFGRAASIAMWVKRTVVYDLGTGENQETAEWTFENKIGTCDEISHLFISLCRSVGLKARYVSGYAFNGEKWLPHAWAEVWADGKWTPFDVAFDEYGYVSAQHIAVYRGADGNHNFILLSYHGDSQVTHEFRVNEVSNSSVNLISSASISDGLGGGYILATLRTRSPFSGPAVFPVNVLFPRDFPLEVVYPADYITVRPGDGEVNIVMKLGNVEPNRIYTIPVNVYLGSEYASLNFSAEGRARCSELSEISPYFYDVSGCTELSSGETPENASSGYFFCGGCFYQINAPESRLYSFDAPEYCEENCALSIEIVGSGPYSIEVNGNTESGEVDVYRIVTMPLIIGVNAVDTDGYPREFEVKRPPEIELNQTRSGKSACFSSNWELEKECYSLRCGENAFPLPLRYGEVEKFVQQDFFRECGFFERILAFFGLA